MGFYQPIHNYKIPSVRQIQETINNLKDKLNEEKQQKKGEPLKTNQFIKPKCICIFDDCESCTSRKITYDNTPEPITKALYSIISSLSVAGRSHSQNKPTIEYICIQHNIAVGGQIRQFNTILLESNLLGLKFSSLSTKTRKYIEDRWSVDLPNKTDASYPGDAFVFFTLTYPHYLIYKSVCLNLN